MNARLDSGKAAAFSLSAMRPSERNARGRAKSEARKIVEAAMAQCTVAMTVEQITARAGLTRDIVRKQIVNICKSGMAYNTTPGKRTALYIAGKPERAAATTQREASFTKPGDYDGAELRPFSARAGALDAFDKPSVVGGIKVDRKPPISISSPVSEARVR